MLRSLVGSEMCIRDSGKLRHAAAVVAYGFHDAESVQPNADAAREHHGEPFVIAEGGFFIVSPELDVFILCTQKVQDADEPDILRGDVQPRKITRDPLRPTSHFTARIPLVGENPDYEAPEGDGRERGGDPVDAQHLCERIKIDRSRETSVSPPLVVETILERFSSRASPVFSPYE